MATSTKENFVPELNRVLNSTETVTLEATKALKGRGIDTEVVKFEGDVKRKIAETRARLNGLPANAVAGAPALVTAPAPAPVTSPAPAPANVTVTSSTTVSSPVPRYNLGIRPASPSDKLNLLKVLNESLINTIQQVITQMRAGNTDFIRRALGYIQILLIHLQNLVVVFNRLDQRLSKIENHFKIPRTLTNTSQPDLEALRKQLEELMRLAPTPPPARTGWFRNPFSRTKGGKRKSIRRKKSSSKTRRRNTKNRR